MDPDQLRQVIREEVPPMITEGLKPLVRRLKGEVPMYRYAVLFVLALSLVPSLAAQTGRTILFGVPDTRVVAHPGGAERDILSAAERSENRVTIAWDGASYRWVTRGDRALTYTASGIYHIFYDPRGGGWVKVLDQRDMPAGLRLDGPDIQFFEHVSLGLTTYTYWGSASAFGL